MAGRVLIGTSSWTDPTLVKEGNFYPPEAKTAEAKLKFYASQFPLVEVDSTYYFPPSERNSVLWIERTPPTFTFNIKAYSLLTNHPTRPDSLYKEIKQVIDPDLLAKRRLYRENLPDAAVEDVWERFRLALYPLHSAGKLGAVLFQFPQWFTISKKSKAYRGVRRALARLSDRGGVPAQELDGRAQRRGDAVVPVRADPALRVRRHAAGGLLEPATDRGGDRRRSRDDPLPRPQHVVVGDQERQRERTVPLRLPEGRTRRVGAPHR
jgi:uncharacterized protein YecE (DUF72 family)